MSLNVNACDWYCYNCNDCIEKINSASEGQTICLNANIINHPGTCINNPANFSNKTFDCQGNRIDGRGLGNGIYLDGKINNTIKNCIITDFRYGIYLWRSSNNNTLANNTMNNNSYGIRLDYSSRNTLANNTANYNNDGISLYRSSNNILTNNIMNNNRHGILLNSSPKNTLTNNTVNNSWSGIYLSRSSGNNLTNNTANNNSYGIYLWDSSNSILTNNTANNNSYGIYLRLSSNNILTNNTMNNNRNGIYLEVSSNNILTNNTMNNNARNFNIWGLWISDFYQDIDTSNKVNGKPIYYWTNKMNAPDNCRNAEINGLNNIGFLALVSCENITVKNLILTKNSPGILLVNTTNSKILDNTVNNNGEGISLHFSSGNILINNTANNNSYGIYLSRSSRNTITNNTANDNSYGIYLSFSSGNNLTNNTVNNNRFWWGGYGIHLSLSSNNTLTNNAVNNNRYGIYLSFSSGNTLTNNTANNNRYYGIYLSFSSGNTLTNNTANNNQHGIYLENADNNNFTLNTVKFNQQHGFRALATSTGNKLTANTFCSNNQSGGDWYDIRDDDANSGNNNTCDTVYNWNDTGRTGCTYPCTIVHGVNNTNIRNATVPAGQTGNITYRICNNGTANGVVYNFTNETGCAGFNITLPAPITLNAGQCQNVNVSVSTPAGSPLTCNVLLNVSNATYGVQATAMGHIATTLQPTGKATDIFDAIEMLEYLSGEKNLARGTDYYDLNDDKTVNLLDVFILIDKILT